MIRPLLLGATLVVAACSKAPAPAAVTLTAPAGSYTMDPYHTTISAGIKHIGLSNYLIRFTKYEGTLTLDPANLATSTVTVTIDPKSIRTDYSGDYAATHKGTPYKTFDEALAMDAKFLDAGKYPQITFTSTRVAPTVSGLNITGDLNFHGVTKPVVLDVTVVGSTAAHPFTQKGAVGFSARTSFKRSDFGMTEYLKPAVLGDDISLQFEGEFHQAG